MVAPNATLQEQVEHFLRVQRFNPPLDLLEAFVDEQFANGKYHGAANLGLLKQYQFYPEKRSMDHCCKILIKALSRPDDFLACMYLLPENVQCFEAVSTLSRLSSLLDTCQFSDFWDELRTEQKRVALLQNVPDLATGIREHIANVISMTYQSVPLDIVVSSLRFSTDKEMEDFFSAKGWERKGDVVTIPKNEENQPKQPKFKEKLSFAQLAPMLNKVVTA